MSNFPSVCKSLIFDLVEKERKVKSVNKDQDFGLGGREHWTDQQHKSEMELSQFGMCAPGEGEG